MWTQRLNQDFNHIDFDGQGVEIVDWAYQPALPTNVPHRHSYFEACLVGAHGEGRFDFDGHGGVLHPGTFFLARPGQIHQIVNTAVPDMELFWVSFVLGPHGKGEIAALMNEFAAASVAVVPAQHDLLARWNALHTLATRPSRAGDEFALTCLAQALMLGIFQTGAMGGDANSSENPTSARGFDQPPHLSVTPCRARLEPHLEPDTRAHHIQLARLGVHYINDNLERPLSIEELCRHLGVSRRQISRVFGAYTGLTPAAYIERARLDRAAALLRHGHKSVKAVAHAVGYHDVHHFTRAFTRVVGTPPGEFRARGGPRTSAPSGPNIPNPGALV